MPILIMWATAGHTVLGTFPGRSLHSHSPSLLIFYEGRALTSFEWTCPVYVKSGRNRYKKHQRPNKMVIECKESLLSPTLDPTIMHDVLLQELEEEGEEKHTA